MRSVFVSIISQRLRRKPRKLLISILLLAITPSTTGKGQAPQIALSQPLTVLWRYESAQTSNFTPATDGVGIYLPLTNGIVVALDVSDGKLRWKADMGGTFSASPAVDAQNIYAAGQYADSQNDQLHVHGTLRALSKTTGLTVWLRTLQAPLSGSLGVAENAVFAGSLDGKIYAFDKRTGLTLWVNQFAQSFSSSPTIADGQIYIGSQQGSLFALDQKTGQAAWRYSASGPIQGPIAVEDGSVFFGAGDGYVYALSKSKARLLWRRRTGAAVQAVVAVGDGLLAASLDNFVYLLSTSKGSLIWRRLLPGRIAARPVTAPDGALFTPLSSDSAVVLGLRDGKPVNALAIGQENSSSAAPITANDLVFITTAQGLLAFARPKEKP